MRSRRSCSSSGFVRTPVLPEWQERLKASSKLRRLNASPEEKRRRRIVEALRLDPSSTSILLEWSRTKRQEWSMRTKPASGSTEERISLQLERMEDREKRLFLLLLERGDLGVLTKERRTRRVLFASRDGKIVVTNKGVLANKAQRAADMYLESIGGMGRIVQCLEVVESDARVPGHVKNVLTMARLAPHKRLSRILAECSSSLAQVQKWVLNGARLAGEAEASTILHGAQAAAARNLAKRVENGDHPEFLESLEAYMAATKMVTPGKGDAVSYTHLTLPTNREV